MRQPATTQSLSALYYCRLNIATTPKATLTRLAGAWRRWNLLGVCAAGMANNNYVVKFPRGASAAQKARVLSALHLIDLNFFERRKNQSVE